MVPTMSSWDAVALKVCKDRGLELLSGEPQAGYYWVKNVEGRPFPLTEERLASWIQQEQAKEKSEE